MYAPFLMKGFVSLTDAGPKVPVAILSDGAASQSAILERVLPLSDNFLRALVCYFGMLWVGVLLYAYIQLPVDC